MPQITANNRTIISIHTTTSESLHARALCCNQMVIECLLRYANITYRKNRCSNWKRLEKHVILIIPSAFEYKIFKTILRENMIQ